MGIRLNEGLLWPLKEMRNLTQATHADDGQWNRANGFCFERHNHCVKVRLFVFAVNMYIDHIIFDYRNGALPAQPKYPFE